MRGLAQAVYERTKPHLNVGTIGHVDHGKVREDIDASQFINFKKFEMNKHDSHRDEKR